MKNILAENLLRFGVKNLSENDKKVLSESLLMEQTAIQAGPLDKHPDAIAMGKVVAGLSKNGKLPYNQLVEYAGTQLYCKISPTAENTNAGSTSAYSEQLSFNVYVIAKSKFGCPVPKFIGSCYVNKLGKVFPTQNAAGAGANVNDNSLIQVTDDTKIGFVGFDSGTWDSYATPKFGVYVNNIIKNPGYLKVVGSSVLSNANLWKTAKKVTAGMAGLLQKIVDAIIVA